jgi:phosphoheptose isomerase
VPGQTIFQRQVIADGRRGDALPAVSTSCGSENVLESQAGGYRALRELVDAA